jgi:hypothetical protein
MTDGRTGNVTPTTATATITGLLLEGTARSQSAGHGEPTGPTATSARAGADLPPSLRPPLLEPHTAHWRHLPVHHPPPLATQDGTTQECPVQGLALLLGQGLGLGLASTIAGGTARVLTIPPRHGSLGKDRH